MHSVKEITALQIDQRVNRVRKSCLQSPDGSYTVNGTLRYRRKSDDILDRHKSNGVERWQVLTDKRDETLQDQRKSQNGRL